VTLAIAVGATAACNAVLGIEEAELDPAALSSGGTGGMSGSASTGGSSTGGTNTTNRAPVTDPPAVGCIEPSPACTSCFSTCTGFDRQRCLMNPTCRKALDDYRTCLGDGCTGGEDCREKLSESQDSDVQALVACLSSDACVTACDKSPLATMCELYCACMADNCTSNFATTADCMTACQTHANADITYCRKMHCEFLEYPNTSVTEHCEHAMGIGQCAGPITVPPGDCDLAFPGFPCQSPADCCNPVCNGEVCG
jgi:hypothetical protein